MAVLINKKTLEYLAELSRIELNDREEERILKDLQKILDYFEELKEINTENTCLPAGRVEPPAGGTIKKNVFREDETSGKGQGTSDRLIEQFPEKQNGFLKVPPVFE